MRQIILLRHGQSVHHILGLTGGWTDKSLTTLGCEQSIAAAEKLIDEGFNGADLYCSDLLRARQTAEAIVAKGGKQPIVSVGLRELNNGLAAGMFEYEAEKIAYQKPLNKSLYIDWQHYPQAETWRQFGQRVITTMQNIEKDVEDTAIIVTHKGCIVFIVAWWLLGENINVENCMFSCESQPASISQLAINKKGERTIIRLNDTSHLIKINIS